MKTKILTMVLVLFTMVAFASTGQDNGTSPANLVLLATPLVVFGVGQLVKLVKPLIPGWAMVVVVVPALSAAVTWVSTIFVEDASWLIQFGAGLLSVFVHQLSKQIKSGD